MENWASVSHLYAWPEPERLRLALAEGAADRVFTTPVVRHDQALKDSMLDAVEVLKGRATPRSAVTQDKEGLKSLIVSLLPWIQLFRGSAISKQPST